MSKTYRDRRRWYWHHHFRHDHVFRWEVNADPCECYRTRSFADDLWCNPYRYETGVPSWWNRENRRVERGHYRNQLRNMRAGNVDPDEVQLYRTKSYRRPWYW